MELPHRIRHWIIIFALAAGSLIGFAPAHADTPQHLSAAAVTPSPSPASSLVKPHLTKAIAPRRTVTAKLAHRPVKTKKASLGHRAALAGYRNPDAGLNLKPPTPQKATVSSAMRPAATSLVSSFNGLNAGQSHSADGRVWHPADVTAAPGVNDVVETTNEALAAYSKTGATLIAPTPLQTWFKTPSTTTVFDPHVTIDPKSSRYAVVAVDGSNWLFSVAQQTSAIGSWCNYTIPAAASGHFADFPQIGVDSRYFYLTIVDYPNPTSGTVEDSRMVAIPRSQAEGCQSVVGPQWTGITDPGTACVFCSNDQYAFRISPATVYDSLDGNGWMADAYPHGGSHITVHYVDSSNTLHSYQISAPTYTTPSPARQSGSTATLDTGYNMFTGVNKTAGELYLAMDSGYDWGNGNVNSVVTWMQINATVGSIGVDKSGSFGYPGLWFFYPSSSGTAPSGYGQVFNFSVSGSSIHPSNAVAAVDYTGTPQGVLYTAQGTSVETGELEPRCGSNCYRWGDYTSTLIDPTNPNTWWSAGIWAANDWSTSISRLGQ